MTRAVLIAPGWPPELSHNGVTSYVARLRPALIDAGADVPVICAHNLPEAADLPRDPSVEYADDEREPRLVWVRNRLLSLYDFRRGAVRYLAGRFEWTLKRLDRERRVDVYEIEEAFGYGRLLAGRAPGLQVVRLHGPWFLCVPAFGLPLHPNVVRIREEGESIRLADAVTSPSRFALEAVRERYCLPLRDAAVIPNATPLAPDELRWSRAAVTPGSILFVGRADRLKGADTVVEAFGRVHAVRPDATLVFAGPDRGLPDGAGGTLTFEAYLRRTLGEEARARVRYLGSQSHEEVAALRRTAELTVVASRFETFGMTVIEAMAAGSPLVAASGGAIPELLDWAADELLFEPGDAEQLAARILASFAEPARAEALAARGRAICAERYTPERAAAQTLANYRRLIARSR